MPEDEKSKCPICGLAYCRDANHYAQYLRNQITANPTPFLARNDVPARYQQARIAKIRRSVQVNHMPLGCGFERIPPESVLDIFDNACEDGTGVFICGASGVGKTYVAAAILADYLPRLVRLTPSSSIPAGVSFIWRYVPELLCELRGKMQGTEQSELQLMRSLVRHEVLVLDDLGCEKETEWAAQTVRTLISRRIDEMRPTIITSNLTLEEIDKRDPRLASRLGGMMYLKIEGEDIRLAGGENK